MNRKGVVLIISFIVILFLTILAAAFLVKSVNENNLTKRSLNSTRAFWLAEEGIAESVKDLTVSSVNGCWTQARGCPQGYTCCYSARTSQLTSDYYQIDSFGTVTFPDGAVVSGSLRAVARMEVPDASNFEHAIETTGELITKGSAYTITGTVNENAALDFSNLFEHSKEELKSVADHLYEDVLAGAIDGITWVDVSSGSELVVAGDLEGSGILIISGDVHFSGTFDFDGIVYVIGELRISGTPTINGSILAESGADIDTTITGHVTINYDPEAITAALANISGVSSQIVSWRQTS